MIGKAICRRFTKESRIAHPLSPVLEAGHAEPGSRSGWLQPASPPCTLVSMKLTARVAVLVLLCLASLSTYAQKRAAKAPARSAARPSAWTVKAEWVHADEEFLASDALQGRGSATR